jgi:flagellar biosynthesis/type III secretory pathway chaperone
MASSQILNDLVKQKNSLIQESGRSSQDIASMEEDIRKLENADNKSTNYVADILQPLYTLVKMLKQNKAIVDEQIASIDKAISQLERNN